MARKSPYRAVENAISVFTEAKASLETAMGQLDDEQQHLRAQLTGIQADLNANHAARQRAWRVSQNISALLDE